MRIWLDGSLCDASESGIPGATHALHYGTAVFEGIRSYASGNGCYLFRLEDHIDRLLGSAKTLRLPVPHSRAETESAIQHVLEANKLTNAYIRPLIFVGEVR